MPEKERILQAFAESLQAGASRPAASSKLTQAQALLRGKAVLILKGDDGAVDGLNFAETSPQIRRDEEFFYTELKGTFQRPDSTLADAQGIIPTRERGEFTRVIRIASEVVRRDFFIVDVRGEARKKTCFLFWPGFRTAKASLFRRFSITPGAAITALHYAQSGFEDLNELALTLKLSTVYRFFPSAAWAVGGNFYVAGLPVYARPSGSALRFLGVNMRIGYVFPRGASPWEVGLYGGVYFTSTFGGLKGLGYKNVSGPQLFPLISHAMKNGSMIAAYFKYSPISTGSLSFLNISDNRELALGAIYYPRSSPARRRIGLTLDYSALSMTVGPVRSSASTLSLGIATSL